MITMPIKSYYDIPPRSDRRKDLFNCIIEIPKGTNQKYEYNEKYNVFQLNRTLPSTLVYPMSYGFIPGTLADDEDPIDICVYGTHPIAMGVLVECGIVGALWLKDKGKMDYKIIVIPRFHAKFKKFSDISDLDPVDLSHTKNFFEIYKLDKKEVVVKNWMNKKQATEMVQKSILSFERAKGTILHIP
jgi:inorganic pyrophosphatase